MLVIRWLVILWGIILGNGDDNMDLNLVYGNSNLPEDITQELINYAENKLNVPPSYLITKLHYEGLWGSSAVGRENNNWGGMTWNNSWSNPYTRPSGEVVTRGLQRPANEGVSWYINYASVQSFLIDWSFLIRKGGTYNVANSETFDLAVKGQFVYGGASCDYAIMNLPGPGCGKGVTNSKRRYELYLEGMKARRNAINNANNGILDILDGEDFSTDEKVDVGNNPMDTQTGNLNDFINSILKDFNDFENNVLEVIYNIFNPFIYDYGMSGTKGNKLLNIKKIKDKIYKVEMTLDISEGFKGLYDSITEKLESEKQDKDNIIEDNDDSQNPNPDGNNVPQFPTNPNLRITSPFGERILNGKKGMHWGMDIGGGGKTHPIYAPQDAEIVENRNGGMSQQTGAGWLLLLKHEGGKDNFFSRYMHLHVQSPIPVGTKVKKGQEIGTMGNTGASYGIHLHFEISTTVDGWRSHATAVDPAKYLKMRF